jgi:hypothetical protein
MAMVAVIRARFGIVLTRTSWEAPMTLVMTARPWDSRIEDFAS